MIYGTCYFVSEASAARYYHTYGYTLKDVRRMLAEESIKVGKPVVAHGEYIVRIDNGTRYAIVSTGRD